MASGAAQLYEEDFVRWSEQQSAGLREAATLGTNLPLDWENLAEEIDSLGRSQRHELRSRLMVILEHLLKLECSPAADRRRGWIDTVGLQRSEIELVIQDSPSLRGEVGAMITQETARMAKHVLRALRSYGEATPEIIGKVGAVSYTEDQVRGDWFPGDAPLPANGERD